MVKRILSFLCLTLILTSLFTIKSVSAEESEETYRIYFFNSEKWNKVYYHPYLLGTNGGPDIDLGPGWPGLEATKEPDSDWWYIDVNYELGTQIIFNSNNQRPQAKELTVSRKTTTYVGVVYDKETNHLIEYDSKEDTEEAVRQLVPIDPNTRTRVWFFNSEAWSNVHIFVWGGTFESEPVGAYLGTKAKRDGKTNWYYYDVHSGLPIHVIFSDGSDLKKAEAYATKEVYMTIGKEKTYPSKEAAEATIDEVIPIPEDPIDEEPTLENRFIENTIDVIYNYQDPNDLVISIIMYAVTGLLALCTMVQFILLMLHIKKKRVNT